MIAGFLEKTTGILRVEYQIGEVSIVATEPIPELEENINRHVVVRIEQGFPLARRTLPLSAHGRTGAGRD